MNIAGNPAIQELYSDFDGDTLNGIRRVRRFVGRREDLEGLIPFIHVDGVKWSLENGTPPFARLTVRYGDADDGTDPDDATNVTTIWTLDGNDLEKSLFDHPLIATYRDSLLAGNGGIPDEAYLNVMGDLRDFLNGTKTWGELEYLTALDSTIAPLVALKLGGVDSFAVSQYVLRRTTIVPATYTSKWPTTNVGSQYTTAELETAELVPATLIFNMPAGAWLKKAPTIQRQQDGGWQIENEWWHADSIPLVLYPAAT